MGQPHALPAGGMDRGGRSKSAISYKGWAAGPIA